MIMNWQGINIRENVGITCMKLLYLNLHGETEEIPTKLRIVGKENSELFEGINLPVNSPDRYTMSCQNFYQYFNFRILIYGRVFLVRVKMSFKELTKPLLQNLISSILLLLLLRVLTLL
jgi:hypothetical protein